MHKRFVLGALAAVLGVLLGTWGTALAQVPVTECGQIVSGDAYLTGDVDCTGFRGGVGESGTAVALGRRGRLDMRGFTLTGGDFGVGCVEPCRHNVEQACFVPRCEVFDSVGGGVITGAVNHGVDGKRVDVSDIIVSSHGDQGIVGDRLRLYNLTVFGNDEGVRGRHVRVSNSTITGNARYGVGGLFIRLYDSTVTGNGFIPGCGPHNQGNFCGDLRSSRKPHLRNSTCETSTGKPYYQGGFDWGVCSLD